MSELIPSSKDKAALLPRGRSAAEDRQYQASLKGTLIKEKDPVSWGAQVGALLDNLMWSDNIAPDPQEKSEPYAKEYVDDTPLPSPGMAFPFMKKKSLPDDVVRFPSAFQGMKQEKSTYNEIGYKAAEREMIKDLEKRERLLQSIEDGKKFFRDNEKKDRLNKTKEVSSTGIPNIRLAPKAKDDSNVFDDFVEGYNGSDAENRMIESGNQAAQSQGMFGVTIRDSIESWRDHLDDIKNDLSDKIIRKIEKEIDSVEKWHIKNKSIDDEI
jgi:hypothetical protein